MADLRDARSDEGSDELGDQPVVFALPAAHSPFFRRDSGRGRSSSRTTPKSTRDFDLPQLGPIRTPRTRQRVQREAAFIAESSRMARGGWRRKRLVSRPPRATSPASVEVISEDTNPAVEESAADVTSSPRDTAGTSSHIPQSEEKLGAVEDLADEASFEASIKTRISAIIDDLVQQITLPVHPAGPMPLEDSEMGALLMKRFLHAACDKGLPSYTDFTQRANSFFTGLASLNVDPSPYLVPIQDLGKALIGIEAVRKFRTELSLRSDAAIAQDLRVQYQEGVRELGEIEDRCYLLQAQQENMDQALVAVHRKVDDLQYQLADAQAQLGLMKTQRAQLASDLETRTREGAAHAKRLSKLRQDRDRAAALSDRTVRMYDFLSQVEEGNSKEAADMIARLLGS